MISSVGNYISNNKQCESKNTVAFGSTRKEVDSTTPVDEYVSSNKITQKGNKNLLIALGGLTLSGLSLLVALKLGKSSQINKAMQAIDTKFADLFADIPKARKTFSKVFLRDISESETVEMLNRYKEIEKLGVTASKDEYFKAIYNEAKNNYGLGSLPTEFKLSDKPFAGNSNILGFTDPLGDVHIRSNLSKSEGFNTIHHELRHLKQRYYAYHYAPEEYVKASQPKNFDIPQEVFEHIFGMPMGQNGIPKAYLKFAENSARSTSNYCPASASTSGYFAQWAEKDAYKAGNDITDFFGIV